MTQKACSSVDILSPSCQEIRSLAKSLDELSLGPRKKCDADVQQIMSTLLQRGQEKSRFAIKALRNTFTDDENQSLFQISIPQNLPKHLAHAKITAQSLSTERLFFEKISLCLGDERRSIKEKETLLQCGAQFSFPSKDIAVFTSTCPTPVVPEEAPLLIVALQCKFQRALVVAAKNLPAAQSALRSVTEELLLVEGQHPELSSFWPILEFIASSVYRSQETLQDIADAWTMPLKPMEEYVRAILRQHKENIFSDALLFFLRSEINLEGSFAPTEEEVSTGSATDYVIKNLLLSKKIVELEEEALRKYEETHQQRSKCYEEAWLTLRKSKRFIKIFSKDGPAWPKRLFSVDEFRSKLPGGPPPLSLLDQLRQERAFASPSPLKTDLPSPSTKKQSKKACGLKHIKPGKHKKQLPAPPCQLNPCKKKSHGAEIPSPLLPVRDNTTRPSKSTPPPPIEASSPKQDVEKKPLERGLYVGKGPELNWQYHWHVKRWFFPHYDVFTQDPFYSTKSFSQKQQSAIYLEHNFGRALHPILVQLGRRFDGAEASTGKQASRYTMLGEMAFSTGYAKKGVFSLSVGANGVIYHAFFTAKKVEDLVAEYKEKGFFDSDDPERTVSEEGNGQLPDDGSHIISLGNESVSVYDSIRNIFMTVYALRDACL